jgi:hypothetical protein
MTTITYKDGVMAADSGLCDGGLVMSNAAPKIARNRHGDLAGAAGSSGWCDKWLDWFKEGEKGDRPEATDGDGALVARASGEMELYDSKGMSYLHVPYYSVGSGYKQAIGAMWMGADAEKAVECGIAHDVYTRGPVVVMKHEPT